MDTQPELIDKDMGKLWGAFREFKAMVEGEFAKLWMFLTGVDGKNGLKGDLHTLKERVDATEAEVAEAIQWGHDIWNVERHKDGQCLGRNAVSALEARLAKDAEARTHEMVELKKTRMTMIGGMVAAFAMAASPIIIELLKSKK